MASHVNTKNQKSRFAVLAVEDDDNSDDEAAAKQSTQNPAPTAKKRNRKKKKEQQDETAQLRELAFSSSSTKPKKPSQSGTGTSTGTSTGTGTGTGGTAQKAVTGQAGEVQWDKWMKADEQNVNDQYKQDLQEAILLSKIEVEQKASAVQTDGNPVGGSASSSNKKKKKKKGGMSLQEFNNIDEISGQGKGDADPKPVTGTGVVCVEDTQFFTNLGKDAQKMITKEKIQEEYKKQYVVQNAQTSHYEKELTKRDKEIIMLRATVQKLQEEGTKMKQGNDRLSRMLVQGEMKEKSALLESLEELTQVKDELTEEINNLRIELEKEKSKSHALQAELKKCMTKLTKNKDKHDG